MNKAALTLALLNNSATAINSQKGKDSLLDEVTDDSGQTTWWIMAPRPGYTTPFDLRKDELVII